MRQKNNLDNNLIPVKQIDCCLHMPWKHSSSDIIAYNFEGIENKSFKVELQVRKFWMKCALTSRKT